MIGLINKLLYKFVLESENKILRIGLIVDSLIVQRSISDIAFWINQEKDIELVLIIQNIPKKFKSKNKFSKIFYKIINYSLNRFFWKIINVIENYYLKKHNLNSIFDLIAINNCSKNKIFVNPIISLSGNEYRYSENDLNLIKHNKLDLIIKCGSGILRGNILSICKFGVISIFHSDNRIHRGVPICFWEVFNRNAKTGFTIQKLNEESNCGDVLLRGYFPTAKYYLLNHAQVLKRSNYYLKYLIKKILDDNKLPISEDNYPYSGKLYKFPDAKSLFIYLSNKLLYQILKDAFNSKVLKKRDYWNVSYAYKKWRELEMSKSHMIINPPNRFLADPFLYKKNGFCYCFLENFDYSANKGEISVYKISKSKNEFLGHALTEDFHLSFPYIFEVAGDLFMIPESHERKQIRLYKCINFPLGWELEKVLIDNICAADTVVFYKEKLWWMLTNTDPLLSGDHQSELSIFYSEDILTKDWKPHKLNPIFIDPARARNGGLFREGNAFFRVSQKHGFCTYGQSANINRIKTINEDFYEEEFIGSIKPSFLKNIKGTHHFDFKEDYSVFDHY